MIDINNIVECIWTVGEGRCSEYRYGTLEAFKNSSWGVLQKVVLKDGSEIRACGVLERLEKVIRNM